MNNKLPIKFVQSWTRYSFYFHRTTIVSTFSFLCRGGEDAPPSGRPVVENCDKIAELVERDQHSSSRSIGQELGMSHQTVIHHLKKLGVTKNLDV